MNVLIIGNGGREHALAWKIKLSPTSGTGLRCTGECGDRGGRRKRRYQAIAIFPKLIRFARENRVGLTVVGPEAPLCEGIWSTHSTRRNCAVFGPSKAAAQLEGSKVFCKRLLRSADVPSADYHVFRDADFATEFIVNRYPNENDIVPLVVKADGLAAGKGVVVCRTRRDALDAIERIMRRREFGDAGKEVIMEERLDGEEASVLAITDGRTILTLPPCQDHKRAQDGDLGPNTGGMGAYCPAPLATDESLRWIEEHVFVPTIHTMKRRRQPFRGVLYAGLMMTHQGPKVLEYNVRFGDPECQPLLMRLKSDLLDILEATVDGRLEELQSVEWDSRPAVCVVMAAEGYPGDYTRGKPIRGLDVAAKIPDVKVFHAGTATMDGQVVTNGGRVLGVSALGDTIAAAKRQAYSAVKCIRWDGAWCRKDIADKAIQVEA